MIEVEHGPNFLIVKNTPNGRHSISCRKFFLDNTYEISGAGINNNMTHSWRINNGRLEWRRLDFDVKNWPERWLPLDRNITYEDIVEMAEAVSNWIVEMGLLHD